MASATPCHRRPFPRRHLHDILVSQRAVDLFEQVRELRTEARIDLDDLRRRAPLVDKELDVEEAVVEPDAAQRALRDVDHLLLRGALQAGRIVEARKADPVGQADRIDDADQREFSGRHDAVQRALAAAEQLLGDQPVGADARRCRRDRRTRHIHQLLERRGVGWQAGARQRDGAFEIGEGRDAKAEIGHRRFHRLQPEREIELQIARPVGAMGIDDLEARDRLRRRGRLQQAAPRLVVAGHNRRQRSVPATPISLRSPRPAGSPDSHRTRPHRARGHPGVSPGRWRPRRTPGDGTVRDCRPARNRRRAGSESVPAGGSCPANARHGRSPRRSGPCAGVRRRSR